MKIFSIVKAWLFAKISNFIDRKVQIKISDLTLAVKTLREDREGRWLVMDGMRNEIVFLLSELRKAEGKDSLSIAEVMSRQKKKPDEI
jgi:hypothetical protein